MHTLLANLSAFDPRNHDVAEAVMNASVSATLWKASTGDLTGEACHGGVYAPLASTDDPRAEGEELAEWFNPKETICVACNGFGMGYHVEAAARKLGRYGFVLCYEPDMGLLRAVLSEVDYTELFGRLNVILVPAADMGTIGTKCNGLDGFLYEGLRLMQHPEAKARLGDTFFEAFTEYHFATRSDIATTISNNRVSLRNELRNLLRYAECPGI